jgi:hypothetical protein
MTSKDSVSSVTSMPRMVRSTAPSMSLSITSASKLQPIRLACMPAHSPT